MRLQTIRNGQPQLSGIVKKVGELRGSLKNWARRGIVAILDQGLISGSNFVVAILLARWLTPQQYGSYALAFEVFLFVSALYGSLILEPMSVFGPSIFSGNLVSYLGELLRIHCVLSFLMTVVLFATAAVLHAIKQAIAKGWYAALTAKGFIRI